MTLQILLNQAVALHREGRLAEAEALYRHVLAQSSNWRINVTMLYRRRVFYGG
jgi:hypothetical protein